MDEKAVFFHVDLDAFFASVEQREHPEYRGKPLVVGHLAQRSVVSTCSYEARRYGIHSAMPTMQAYRLCPHAVFVDGNYRLYSKVSRQVMDILREYAPQVNQVSIDEAWMDMTGTRLLFGPPKQLANRIKERIKNEVGITLSIGIAASPFIAKMASDYNKPDGLCMVSPGKEEFFIDAIGLEKIWGIGKSSLKVLNSKGLFTPAQVREISLERLEKICGNAMGLYVYKACRGIDPGMRNTDVKSHSISTERTFINDITDRETLHQVLLGMSKEIMERSLDENVMARTVGLKLRWGNFRTITVQETPENGLLNSDQIYRSAVRLLASRWNEGEGIRLIGLGLYQTYPGDVPVQDTLFSGTEHRKRDLDKVIRKLESKGHRMKKASELAGDDNQ